MNIERKLKELSKDLERVKVRYEVEKKEHDKVKKTLKENYDIADFSNIKSLIKEITKEIDELEKDQNTLLRKINTLLDDYEDNIDE